MPQKTHDYAEKGVPVLKNGDAAKFLQVTIPRVDRPFW
jgi:hypothetical protein